MTFVVRTALEPDFSQMSELLSQIIAIGDTTAHRDVVTADELLRWHEKYSGSNAWHISIDEAGQIVGFQFIEPHDDLPKEAADIATYVRVGADRQGIGSGLFQASRKAAIILGYSWLNATIRSDNAGGLAYYTSRGFQTYHTDKDVALSDGAIVTKISKRIEI